MISATFVGVLEYIGYILLALVCLTGMVAIHEFGHYLAAKIFKIKVNEFSIGFGPKIIKIKNKKNGELFSIRPIPLGGFCAFPDVESAEAGEDTSHYLEKQKPWKRIIVLFGGVLFNFLSAIIIITFVFTFFGQALPTVRDVYDESYIAQNNILQEGDLILGINGRQLNILEPNDLSAAFSRIKEDEEGTITVLRDNKRLVLTIKRSIIYERDAEGNYVYDENNEIKTYNAFGILTTTTYVKLNFFRALERSFGYCFFIVYKIFFLLGQLLTGGISFRTSVGGTITVIDSMAQAAKSGAGIFCYVISLISANLAVMNLLPIPGLDGAKIVLTVVEWITGKRLNKKVEGIIDLVFIAILIVIAVLADIFHFLS